MIFRQRATSPNMNAFILLCQIISFPEILSHCGDRICAHRYSLSYVHPFADIYISYTSIWNLDFFQLVYPPFCLHPNATTLQVLSLDYIIAAYPLVLIILTCTLVTLHYYNCRLVVCLWRPFLRCCIRFQRQCDIRNSLVDIFATFLLLSYVKFLSVSFDILTPSFVWNMTWTRQPTVLYYDGSVEYILFKGAFAICCFGHLCTASVHFRPHGSPLPLSLPLLSEALECLSLEISTTSHILWMPSKAATRMAPMEQGTVDFLLLFI